MTQLEIANVPIPFSGSGKISAEGLEKYVRWMRRQNLPGVLVWSPIGRGDRIDSLEREEIYSTWRAGLTPSCKVLCAIPAGFNSDVPPDEIRLQAQHAIELGCDGIVMPDSFAEELPDLSSQISHLGAPSFHVKRGPFSTMASESGPKTILSLLAAACGANAASASAEITEILLDAPEELLPQIALFLLTLQGVISPTHAFDPFAANLTDDWRARIEKAWTIGPLGG